jgi:hypothetical protein
VHRKVSRNDREDDHGEKDEESEKGKEGKESSQGQTGCEENGSQEVGEEDCQEDCQEDRGKARYHAEDRKGPGPAGQNDQDHSQGQDPGKETGSREGAGCGRSCAEAGRAACSEAAHGRATEATGLSGSEADHAGSTGRGCTETRYAAGTAQAGCGPAPRYAETGRAVANAQHGFPAGRPGFPCTAQTGCAAPVVAVAERPHAALWAWLRRHKRFVIALCSLRPVLRPGSPPLALSCSHFGPRRRGAMSSSMRRLQAICGPRLGRWFHRKISGKRANERLQAAS